MTAIVTVEVETTAGSRYVFPDVSREMLDVAITLRAWERVDNVILVNTSAACLSIPKHTVARILVGKEVVWPSSSA